MAKMLDQLADRIWSHPELHIEMAQLQRSAAALRYGDTPEHVNIELVVLKRLLRSAVALSASPRIEHRTAAYQIASSATEVKLSSLPGVAYLLLLVLSRIGNFPALSFARTKFGISELSLPTRSVAEIIMRSDQNTISLGDRSIILTDFQFKLWDRLNNSQNVGVSAPTSAGKSFVLQTYARQRLLDGKTNNIAFLVPTRALINQVSDDIANWLNNEVLNAELVTTPVPRDIALPKRSVFVITQERLQLLQAAHKDLYFDILIVDEAQSLGEGPRGVLLTSVIDEALIRNSNTQLLFAGPNLKTPGTLTSQFGRHSETVSTSEPTVIQNIIFVDTNEVQPNLATISIKTEKQKVKISEITFDQKLLDHKSKLVNVALKLGNEGQNLIYALGPSECEEIAVALADTESTDIPDDLKELSNFIKDAVHPKYQLSHTVLNGVGYHYGRQPSLVRKAIEDAFASGSLRYLVTTSTLLYGVNMPARNLFLHNPQRGKDQPITSNDFWNLAGRAGRLGKEFSGNIFLIDYAEWPTTPMEGERDQEVTPTLEHHLRNEICELIEYIQDPNRVPDRQKADPLENTFVKLVRDQMSGRLETTLSRALLDLENPDTLRLITAVEGVVAKSNINQETIESSPTVSIHRQQALYDRLVQSLRKKGPEYIIPKYPQHKDAYQSYLAAMKRCHGAILKYPQSDCSHIYYTQLALRWIKGTPLPQIIDGNMEYLTKKKQRTNLATTIRNTLSEIEVDLRFKYVRLFSCYNAVLSAVLSDNALKDLTASIPSIPMYLELGACSPSMISFMGLGLSRYTALKLSDKARRADMSQLEARAWIKRQDIEALDIPRTSIREIRRLVVG